MFGSFNATKEGLTLIYIALAGTTMAALGAVLIDVFKVRAKVAKVELYRGIAALLPSAVATLLWCLAKTEHLGLDVFLLMIGIPSIFVVAHLLPVLVLFFLSRDDAETRIARARLLLAAFIVDVVFSGIAVTISFK